MIAFGIEERENGILTQRVADILKHCKLKFEVTKDHVYRVEENPTNIKIGNGESESSPRLKPKSGKC